MEFAVEVTLSATQKNNHNQVIVLGAHQSDSMELLIAHSSPPM